METGMKEDIRKKHAFALFSVVFEPFRVSFCIFSFLKVIYGYAGAFGAVVGIQSSFASLFSNFFSVFAPFCVIFFLVFVVL